MKITLPPLENIIYQKTGSQNIVKHLIAPQKIITIKILEQSRFYLIIDNDQEELCLSTKVEYIPEGVNYALLTNILPNQQRFEEDRITIKGWIRHPRLKEYLPHEINNSWKNDFAFKEEDGDEPCLRQPQIAALHMILGHLKLPLEAATVVMPTGTGKTETMLATLLAHRCEKLLVTVPSDSLRNQIADKFITLGLLKQFGIIGNNSLYPAVGIIKNKFGNTEEITNFLEKCNVVITTMSWLTNQDAEIQILFSKSFSHVFIDEAHHVKASSWNELRNRFDNEKIIQFTATPFRNDGKRLDGKIISNFLSKKLKNKGITRK
ncbi:MAG: DEAD/DEAH box helicase family protein [Spirosomataceae bacterium]